MVKAKSHAFFFFPELIASRASAWTHIASRKYVIHKVYTGSIDVVGGDIMMRGNGAEYGVCCADGG
jgi:hypothetical protein